MKLKRHSKIIEIINEFEVETQEELADRLRESGFEVTQATVSRDIRELLLTKTLTPNGTYKYISIAPADKHITERLIRVFRESVIGLDYAQNIVVIKTLSGTASAVAAAFDSMNMPESVGSLAGNDVIFCATRSNEKAEELLNKLKLIAYDDMEN